MSLLFYAWGEPVYVLLMIASILLNFLLGKGIGGNVNKEQRKALLIVAVIINLSSLAVFKYAGMLAEFVNALNPYNNNLLPVPEVRLPIGISFFTFQCKIRSKAVTHSVLRRTPVPDESGHPFRAKADTFLTKFAPSNLK